jgi:hypothetical protein
MYIPIYICVASTSTVGIYHHRGLLLHESSHDDVYSIYPLVIIKVNLTRIYVTLKDFGYCVYVLCFSCSQRRLSYKYSLSIGCLWPDEGYYKQRGSNS